MPCGPVPLGVSGPVDSAPPRTTLRSPTAASLRPRRAGLSEDQPLTGKPVPFVGAGRPPNHAKQLGPEGCPSSTSTASEWCRAHAAEAPGSADRETVCAEARKSPPQRVSGVSGDRLRAPRPFPMRLTSRLATRRPFEAHLTGLSFGIDVIPSGMGRRKPCPSGRNDRAAPAGRSARSDVCWPACGSSTQTLPPVLGNANLPFNSDGPASLAQCAECAALD